MAHVAFDVETDEPNTAQASQADIERAACRMRTFLIIQAQHCKTCTYAELAENVGIQLIDGKYTPFPQRGMLNAALAIVMEWCQERGMPPLPVLAVRKSGADAGLPGKGFWDRLKVPVHEPVVEGSNPVLEKQLRAVRKLHATILKNQVWNYWQMG